MKPNPNWRGDPLFLPDLFRHFGIKFKEMPGWKLWGMGDFGHIQGVFWHHTGARNTSAAYIARNPGLSNALSSQFHTAPDGTHTLCGAGIAWHAGRGWGKGWPTNNANPISLGFEMQHNGTDTWPEAQLDSTRRATAVILWFLGKRATVSTMIGHWEYSMQAQGKWDPGKGNGVSGAVMDMAHQRRLVNDYIDNINKYGRLDKPTATNNKGNDVTFEQLKVFVTGFFKPWFDNWNQVWEQLRGPGGNGWEQLGKNHKGQNLTLVDAVAALRQDVARIAKQLEDIKAGK